MMTTGPRHELSAAAIAGTTMRALTLILVAAMGLLPAGRPLRAQSPRELSNHRQITTRYTAGQVAAWQRRLVDGKACRISPRLDFGAGAEVNHHSVRITTTGTGSAEFSLVHSRSAKLDETLAKKHLRSRFRKVVSGAEAKVRSQYRGERYLWLLVRPVGTVRITGISHTCWRGQGTLYGHAARTFEFAGAKLPYRLMAPRDYKRSKAYPLVVSVSGSGGVGTKNVRNMEMVILGRYLFTNYYDDESLACFSVVPQIPPPKAVPAPYWPKGRRGAPTPLYHPDWPAVNENGWYAQATLALIKHLIDDKAIAIDPDRVYYSGFSYGGKGCWEFLKAGRETFAAGMCGAGWPIGPAAVDPAGMLLGRLKLEVRRYKHVPVFIFAGGADRMRFGSRAVHKEILAQGGKSTYVEFPRITHVGSAGRGWANRKHVAWMFSQNRRSNPRPGKDPFPRGVYPE